MYFMDSLSAHSTNQWKTNITKNNTSSCLWVWCCYHKINLHFGLHAFVGLHFMQYHDKKIGEKYVVVPLLVLK